MLNSEAQLKDQVFNLYSNQEKLRVMLNSENQNFKTKN
jgi:hypothetical protein